MFSLKRILTLLALLLGLVKLCACTVLLDTQVRQCQTNADCARFGESLCNLDTQLCVPAAVPMKTADGGSVEAGAASCTGKNGCFACAPRSDPEFMNGCTDARCVPFDNRRLRNLTPDGLLKPLP